MKERKQYKDKFNSFGNFTDTFKKILSCKQIKKDTLTRCFRRHTNMNPLQFLKKQMKYVGNKK